MFVSCHRAFITDNRNRFTFAYFADSSARHVTVVMHEITYMFVCLCLFELIFLNHKLKIHSQCLPKSFWNDKSNSIARMRELQYYLLIIDCWIQCVESVQSIRNYLQRLCLDWFLKEFLILFLSRSQITLIFFNFAWNVQTIEYRYRLLMRCKIKRIDSFGKCLSRYLKK